MMILKRNTRSSPSIGINSGTISFNILGHSSCLEATMSPKYLSLRLDIIAKEVSSWPDLNSSRRSLAL